MVKGKDSRPLNDEGNSKTPMSAVNDSQGLGSSKGQSGAINTGERRWKMLTVVSELDAGWQSQLCFLGSVLRPDRKEGNPVRSGEGEQGGWGRRSPGALQGRPEVRVPAVLLLPPHHGLHHASLHLQLPRALHRCHMDIGSTNE